ncbi:hypothetical protein [Paenarthrobacter aurescens]|uniref:Uncharacterized protein n=1 Tax=Paenarthrobacter aurescens TaxID=43663 RepID=A0A4Y3NCA3_PAEAU|nr:hypothetical protein [Paenarthrobacter aurescens]MDO6142939.1 hypothetical protein [Paenarthrobacter aurescens]MDO6146784.1 hypothetical protein [Paenarthrobacter aurescens]MDO6158030.1 hypothetical protein [Paenarthrobacter aurescens]MDO6162015.1 hypothetical protein [Paenarthrobacter aurescens]GEB19470.1 hypothetical protein AAU01_22250 [Paenarthrobacter aurescens]
MTQNVALPALYDRMIERGIVDLEPWELLRGAEQAHRLKHLVETFPEWPLNPFAHRSDNDDVACWTGENVVVVDDYDVVRDANEAAVRHQPAEYHSMDEWLIVAIRDFIEFD